MWFDPKAALAKIENKGVATSATTATRQAELHPRVAVVADVAAPPRQKTNIIGMQSLDAHWTGEDYAAFFCERAAIAEFDGGLSRLEAEAQAFECCVMEWLNRNLVCSPSDHCLGCGKAEQTNYPLLPFGAHANGHAWLHEGCWSEWCQARKVQAVAALLSMRIICRSLLTDR